MKLVERLQKPFDRFLFESCDPIMASVLRIAYATLLIVDVCVWMLDGSHWFSDDGVVSAESIQRLYEIPYWSVFFISSSTALVQVGLVILLVQSCLLLFGCWSRFQAACIFFWLVSFQHRNPLICDGEDTVFRLFAFFMIFLPLDCDWSLSAKFYAKSGIQRTYDRSTAWGLRLVQFEMTAIYLSASWSKLQGATWRDGSALYYVSRMDDYFGRSWLPESTFDIPWLIRCATWVALSIEFALPWTLWFRRTRRLAIIAGIGLHLCIETTMNLFLFEWIMIVGLLAFVKPEEWGIKIHKPR